MKLYHVYLLTNRHRSAVYTGVTGSLEHRVHQHKTKAQEGFTSRYHVDRLVYYEETNDIGAAITREKQIKGWTRAKKVALIESVNPHWLDLAETWFSSQPLRDPTTPPPDSFAKMRSPGEQTSSRSE